MSEAWFPEGYGQDTADAICEHLADGTSLRAICRLDGMPSTSTVCKWLSLRSTFAEQYTRAREAQADALFDEILDIADTHERGEKRTTKADGAVETVEADMIEHRKLRIDARKWMAGKLRPKKYGDKTLIGNDPDNPLPAPSTDTDLARLIVFQLTKASRDPQTVG